VRGLLPVFRREFGARIDAPSALVVTLVFALVAQGLFFFMGHPIGDLRLPSFWAGRVASLQVVFAWIPLLFVGFVPALTMGAWAEERATGTEELLLSWPLSGLASSLAKFLAVWLFLGLALLVTILPLAVVVSSLGDLDWGVVWCGLFGAFLLGGACASVSLLLSALFREQLAAFLASALLLGLLWASGLLVANLPAALAEVVFYASPYAHFFDSAARGVFDARDLVYHGALIAAGIVGNTLLVEGRRWR
jgi:ABC-2 type transport system permease protein